MPQKERKNKACYFDWDFYCEWEANPGIICYSRSSIAQQLYTPEEEETYEPVHEEYCTDQLEGGQKWIVFNLDALTASCQKQRALKKHVSEHREGFAINSKPSCKTSPAVQMFTSRGKFFSAVVLSAQWTEASFVAESLQMSAWTLPPSAFMRDTNGERKGLVSRTYYSNCKGNSWLWVLWLPGVCLMPHVHLRAFCKYTE